MELDVFADDSRAISDCNQSLLKSAAKGHVKVNLAHLSKSDLGNLFNNITAELSHIHRLNLCVSCSGPSCTQSRQAVNRHRGVDFPSTEYDEIMKNLSTRMTGAKAVSGLPSLLHLSLRGSQIGDEAIQELCSTLQQGDCSVTHLELSGCLLTDCSASAVAALMKNGALKLCMERFKKFLREYPDSSLAPRIRKLLFRKRTAALTAELRASCPGLVYISLHSNSVTDVGASTLFDAAMASSTIQFIDLRSNRLTMRAGRAARAVMIDHDCLRVVDMRQNCALKLGLLRDDHVKALKTLKSTGGACGVAGASKQGLSLQEAEQRAVSVPGDTTGAHACVGGGEDDGNLILPFRPDDVPASTSAAGSVGGQTCAGASCGGSDGGSDSGVHVSAMEAVVGVFERMYSDGSFDVAASGHVSKARAGLPHNGEETQRSSTPERWAEGSKCVDASTDVPADGCLRHNEATARAVAAVSPASEVSAAAAPVIRSEPAAAEQAQHEVSWQQQQCGSSSSVVRWSKAESVMSGRQPARGRGPATGWRSSAVCGAHGSKSMELSSWRRDDQPPGRCGTVVRHRPQHGHSAGTRWLPLAQHQARQHAPLKKSRRKKKNAKKQADEPSGCLIGHFHLGAVGAEASATAESVKRGQGRTDLQAQLAAHVAPTGRRGQGHGVGHAAAAYHARFPAQFGPSPAMASKKGKGQACKTAARDRTSSTGSAEPRDGGLHEMPQRRYCDAAVKHAGVQAGSDGGGEGTGAAGYASALQGGFISMHDVCTWERQRDDSEGAASGSPTGSASTTWDAERVAGEGVGVAVADRIPAEETLTSVSFGTVMSSSSGEELHTLDGGRVEGPPTGAGQRASGTHEGSHVAAAPGTVRTGTPWGVEATALEGQSSDGHLDGLDLSSHRPSHRAPITQKIGLARGMVKDVQPISAAMEVVVEHKRSGTEACHVRGMCGQPQQEEEVEQQRMKHGDGGCGGREEGMQEAGDLGRFADADELEDVAGAVAAMHRAAPESDERGEAGAMEAIRAVQGSMEEVQALLLQVRADAGLDHLKSDPSNVGHPYS